MTCMEKWIDAYVPDVWLVSEGADGSIDFCQEVVDYETQAIARQRLEDAIGDENPTEAQLEEFYQWQFIRVYAKALALAGTIMNLGIGQQQATLAILERTKKRTFVPHWFIDPTQAILISNEDQDPENPVETLGLNCEDLTGAYPDYGDKLSGWQPSAT